MARRRDDGDDDAMTLNSLCSANPNTDRSGIDQTREQTGDCTDPQPHRHSQNRHSSAILKDTRAHPSPYNIEGPASAAEHLT